MITKEEFLKALNIINDYKKQVSEEFEYVKKQIENKNFSMMVITEESFLIDINLSVRSLNVLHSLSYKSDKFKHLNIPLQRRSPYKIKDFLTLKKSDLYMCQNTGQKTIEEIEKCFFQAGIII